ncbi:MAG: serine/threonine-protein kinase [Planctomycetaceae bacterium]
MSPEGTNAGRLSECPGEKTLRQFGDLNVKVASEDTLSPDDPAVALLEHVEVCDSCQRRLEAIAVQDRNKLEELFGSTDGTIGSVSACAEVDNHVLKGFRILRLLGRGGQSKVYLAEELPACRCVALKLIPVSHEDSERQREQWLSEVRAAASIEHQNVVRLYRVEETLDHFLLVFEHINGGTLRDWLSIPVSQIQIARLVEILARTVHQIHQRGILHLDLKPSNILMETSSGTSWELAVPKIADFGVSSRRSRLDGDGRKQCPRWVRGTPSYMAPEQILGVEDLLTSATDVYGLGAVLYCMLTGRPPLTFETGSDSLEQLLASDIVAPADVDPAVDQRLSEIAMKCLRRQPEDRFQTAIELSESLNEWIHRQTDPRPNFLLGKQNWLVTIAAAVGLTMFFAYSQWFARSDASSGNSVPKSTNAPAPTSHTRFADAFFQLSARDSLAEIDEPFLLQRLYDRSPALTVEQAAQLAFDSSRFTDQLLEKPDVTFEQCLRVATLQHASGSRFQDGGLDEYYPAATYLLNDSRRLLQFVRQNQPDDQLVLEKLIAVEAGLATVRVEKGLNTPELVQKHYRRNLAVLLSTLRLVNELKDQRQRIYWSGFILDAFRLHYWGSRFTGDMAGADIFRAWERTAWDAFRCDHSTADLSMRHILMQTDLGALSSADDSAKWIHEESRTVLRREFLFLRLAEPFFAQEHNPDFRMRPGDSLQVITDPQRTVWLSLLQQISQDMRVIDFQGLTVPALLHEDLVRPLTLICTQYRAAGQIDEAERLQRKFLELCEVANELIPDNTDIHLALSEAHLQTWKNEIRRDRPDLAIEALQRSLKAAEAAVASSPGTSRARDQVADRIKRLTRFEASRAK